MAMQRSKTPKTKQVLTMLTPEDKDALDALAYRERLSRSECVRDIIRDRLRLEPHLYVMAGVIQPGLFEEGTQ